MIKCKMFLYIFLFSVFCILPTILLGQVHTAWVRTYNGPGNLWDYAYAIAVDGQANVYVTGYSVGSGTEYDYATIKYNAAGVEQWVQTYNGPVNGWDFATAIAVDAQANVYVTGESDGSGTSYDYATIKYNAAGIEQWVQRYNGPGNDYDRANAIAIDGSVNVYVTGSSYGSGTFDYATIKYNAAGVQQWVRTYNGPGNGSDVAYAIAVDGQANVYVTGSSYGSGTYTDYATIKYNSAGVQQWVRTYNGPGNSYDYTRAIAVDGSGNVYVTGESPGSGTSYDYVTIKYNAAGIEQWVQTYNGPGNGSDVAYAIAVDDQANVYVTGSSFGSGTLDDYATIKYNSAGIEQWVQTYNSPGNSSDYAGAIAVDGQGNVYVTGESDGSGTFDYATIKYNSAGTEQWERTYNGPGNGDDWASAIAVDGQANVYVTGVCRGSGTFDDYATIKYVQTSGVEEIGSLPLAMTNKLEIYPNPAKSFFVVRLADVRANSYSRQSGLGNPSHNILKIFDVTGKVVKEILPLHSVQGQNDNTILISLDGIKNGVYFVQVGQEMVKEKLVVTK